MGCDGRLTMNNNRYNLLVAGAIGVGCVVLIPFVVALAAAAP
jgi:hypothetical protein